MLITKQPFKFDPIGDTDMENITQLYKDIEGNNNYLHVYILSVHELFTYSMEHFVYRK